MRIHIPQPNHVYPDGPKKKNQFVYKSDLSSFGWTLNGRVYDRRDTFIQVGLTSCQTLWVEPTKSQITSLSLLIYPSVYKYSRIDFLGSAPIIHTHTVWVHNNFIINRAWGCRGKKTEQYCSKMHKGHLCESPVWLTAAPLITFVEAVRLSITAHSSRDTLSIFTREVAWDAAGSGGGGVSWGRLAAWRWNI